MSDHPITHPSFEGENDIAWMQHQLIEQHKVIRNLLRQLSKEQTRHAETSRAYQLTVANLLEANRETSQLTRDRDSWRVRAEHTPQALALGDLPFTLSEAEIGAIRKAILRLYKSTTPDTERVKQWQVALDPIEPS